MGVALVLVPRLETFFFIYTGIGLSSKFRALFNTREFSTGRYTKFSSGSGSGVVLNLVPGYLVVE